MISVYNKKTEIELGIRRLEIIDRYNKIIQYGRKNPVWFIENILKVELLDYQKWLIMNSWDKERAVWCCSRNAGKTFVGALYIMAKNLLFPSFETWLMSLTASQSQGLFMKMENIARKNIASVSGSSDVFIDELIRTNASSGFTHGKQSFVCELFNGSKITSLVGTPETIVGKRSNLNVYDEAGKITDNFFTLTIPFTTQDSNFATGAGVDLEILPKRIPTQCLFMSSAEDVDSYFYKMYKECAKSMMFGDNRCFVADITCDIPLKPTKNGKKYAPLFNKSVVETAMRTDESLAMREYYNKFDSSFGNDAIITRDIIFRNEKEFLPEFNNLMHDEDKYGIFFDPAAVADGSVILVARYFKDPEVGWKCRFVNCMNLVEQKQNMQKRLMNTMEQQEKLKELILDYTQGHSKYDNLYLFIDPGAGGGGRLISQQLMLDFKDKYGMIHPGIVDEKDEVEKLELYKYPSAATGVKRLLSAIKYKNEMFSAFSDLARRDLIEFPVSASSVSSGVMYVDEQEHQITKEEMRVFVEMDMLKEESKNIIKTKTESGNIKFTLPQALQKTHHDDRAYVAAAAAYYLQQLRHQDTFKYNFWENDFTPYLTKKTKPVRSRAYKNPFSKKANPFRK